MPSDKSTVATKADFVPKVVGKTDRDRSFSSVLAHDERSQQPRPEVHPEALNVLSYYSRYEDKKNRYAIDRRSSRIEYDRI